MSDTTTGLYDVDVVMVRRYKAVKANGRVLAEMRAELWARAWAKRSREKDGKEFRCVGAIPATTKG